MANCGAHTRTQLRKALAMPLQRGHLIAESDRHRLLQSACEVTGCPKSICSRLINRDHGLADFGGPHAKRTIGWLREIIFRQGCEARRKYLSAWPLGGLLCSGGDLNPILGFCFPLFSRVLPGRISIRVETCGTGRKQKCGLLWRIYIQSFDVL